MRYLLPVLLSFLVYLPLSYAQVPLDSIIARWEAADRLGSGGWGSWTAEEEKDRLDFLDGMLAQLSALPTAGLSKDDRINRRLLTFIVEDARFRLAAKDHRFPLNSEGGFLSEIVYALYGEEVTSAEEWTAYRERLRALPTYLGWVENQLRAGQQAGQQSPRLIVDKVVGMIDRLLEQPVAETLFFLPLGEESTYAAQLLPLVRDTVLPAYRKIGRYLTEDYRPTVPEAVGVANMTGGKAYYEQRVRYFTTYDATPQEVFDTGQREVARIRKEMEGILDELNFDGTFADFLHFLRTDERFYAKTPEELLMHASWITKRMEGKLPRYFGRLPRMPLTVAPVPAALAPNYTGGRYSPGNYHTHRAGEFWVNTYDLPSRPLYVLPALALHEGVPGHHTQMMLSAELADRPQFRTHLYLSAYGEGWALYGEYLGREAGMYTTPYERFGQLTYEMWRACRLVVDPGMHYFGWTRDRAVAFLRDNTALSLHEINTEIDRYIGWPGQAVSYKMGELKIRALRERAEAAMGEDFDLRAFHDLVLSEGAVTMEVLEEMVEEGLIK